MNVKLRWYCLALAALTTASAGNLLPPIRVTGTTVYVYPRATFWKSLGAVSGHTQAWQPKAINGYINNKGLYRGSYCDGSNSGHQFVWKTLEHVDLLPGCVPRSGEKVIDTSLSYLKMVAALNYWDTAIVCKSNLVVIVCRAPSRRIFGSWTLHMFLGHGISS